MIGLLTQFGINSITIAAANILTLVSGNLVVDKTQDATLNSADYVVYDWQRSTNSGATWNSTAVSNMMFAETALPTKSYSTFSQEVTIVGSPVYAYNSGDGNGGYTYPAATAGLRLAHNSNFNLETGASTIFVRYKKTASSQAWHEILTKIDGWNGEYGFIHDNGNGNVRFVAVNSLDTFAGSNVWVTVAESWNGGTAKRYVNGVLKQTTTTTRAANTHSFDIGYTATPYSGVDSLEGIIAEFIIYRHVLSDDQITFLHNKERNKVANAELTALGGWWRVRATPITTGVAGTPVISNIISSY